MNISQDSEVEMRRGVKPGTSPVTRKDKPNYRNLKNFVVLEPLQDTR